MNSIIQFWAVEGLGRKMDNMDEEEYADEDVPEEQYLQELAWATVATERGRRIKFLLSEIKELKIRLAEAEESCLESNLERDKLQDRLDIHEPPYIPKKFS